MGNTRTFDDTEFFFPLFSDIDTLYDFLYPNKTRDKYWQFSNFNMYFS